MAELALQMLPGQVVRLQKDASHAYQLMKQAVKHVHLHMVRVARASIAIAEGPKAAMPKPMDHQPLISWHQIALVAADRAPANLRFPGFSKLLTWLQQIHDPKATPKWYSWYELLFAFQIMTGEWGIQSTSKHNTWQLFGKSQEYDLKQTCRSWASFLIQMIRLVLPEFKAVDNRPSNGRFRCWTMGVMSTLAQDIDDKIHAWLQLQLGDRPVAKIATLMALPVASLATPQEEPTEVKRML